MPGFHRALTMYIALALAGFAALAAVFFPFTAEDAWIVARYARNAVEHGELVFNRGEYVNALTSPLDAMLRIVLHAATADPVLAHKICTIASSAIVLAIGVLILRPDTVAQATFMALTALSAPFVLWTLGGLETPLLALLVALFVACLWRAGHERIYLAAMLAGLAFLARHDSVLFTGPALLWTVYRAPFSRWIGVGLTAAVLPFAWLAFALVYFHDIMPTSFHLKGPGNVGLTVGYNALYLLDFFLQSGVALAVVAAFALAQGRLIGPGLAAILRGRGGLWFGLAVSVGIYGLLAATAHMMFSFRLLVPYLPVMALLAAELLGKIVDGTPERGARRAVVAVLAVVTLLQVALADALQRWTLNSGRVGEYQYSGAHEYRRSFIDTLPEAAAAIDADWRAGSAERPPRVLTFAAGLLPWHLPDAYIFEDLVSWRRACPPDRYKHAHMADYVHLVTPWTGTIEEQLPGGRDRWQQVWERTTLFDGSLQTWMVFRNREPDPTRLPPYVDGACRLPAP
jgi:MFS family permease